MTPYRFVARLCIVVASVCVLLIVGEETRSEVGDTLGRINHTGLFVWFREGVVGDV